MITLSMEFTDEAEKGFLGVGVTVGVFVGAGVPVAGTKFAEVLVTGGVKEGNKVAVSGTNIVGVAVQVAFN